jgi:peptidoglycan biosynthesis protein MviN/MurJ (putative lipid II flippase)
MGEQPDYNSRLRLITLLAVPIGVMFAVFSPQIVDVAYGRGRFTADDVQKLSLTLQAYAPAIVALALTSVPLGLAYARQQSREILCYFALTSVLLVAIELILVALGVELRAFGAALTLSTFISLIWLERQVRQDTSFWVKRDTLVFLLVAVIVLIGTFLVRLAAMQIVSEPWANWIILTIGGAAAVALTGLAARALAIKELDQLIQIFRRGYKPVGG